MVLMIGAGLSGTSITAALLILLLRVLTFLSLPFWAAAVAVFALILVFGEFSIFT